MIKINTKKVIAIMKSQIGTNKIDLLFLYFQLSTIMSETVAIRESTIHSLQVIFAYQGQQLIKKIGKEMGWDDKEIKSLVNEFINKKK